MEKSYEIIGKSEVVLEPENLEVTERIKTIKTLMDFVIGYKIIEDTNDILELFNSLLKSDFDFVIDLLKQKYPLFEFQIIDSVIKARTSKIDNCRSVPSFVTSLSLFKCGKLKSLNGLHEGLKEMFILFCSSLPDLEGLPDGLEKLKIGLCHNLTSSKGLPKGLNSLELTESRLKNLEGLPEGLESLTINDCFFKYLKDLPKGLKNLKIKYCENLTSLEGLPEGLQNLQIDERSRRNLDEESLKMLEEFGV